MSFEDKVAIVAGAFQSIKQEPTWDTVVRYLDIGLPLAYMYHVGIVNDMSDTGKDFIDEAYAVILSVLELPADAEYASWEAVNEAALAKNGK